MSRIGNHPIPLPPKVEVTLAPGAITVKGPLGTLARSFGIDAIDLGTVADDRDALAEALTAAAASCDAVATSGGKSHHLVRSCNS